MDCNLQNPITKLNSICQHIDHTLQRIAALCPADYGDVVYGARGLIADFDNTRYELTECISGGPRERIELKTNEIGLAIYPNPSIEKIYLNFDGYQGYVSIDDISGKSLISDRLINSGDEIDISNFENGLYITTVKVNEKILVTKFLKVE
jgi:hypothetical protein